MVTRTSNRRMPRRTREENWLVITGMVIAAVIIAILLWASLQPTP